MNPDDLKGLLGGKVGDALSGGLGDAVSDSLSGALGDTLKGGLGDKLAGLGDFGEIADIDPGALADDLTRSVLEKIEVPALDAVVGAARNQAKPRPSSAPVPGTAPSAPDGVRLPAPLPTQPAPSAPSTVGGWDERYQRAIDLVKNDLPADVDPEVKDLISDIIQLMEVSHSSNRPMQRMAVAELALSQLVPKAKNVALARQLVEDLRRRLGGPLGMAYLRFKDITPPTLDVLLGMATSLVFLLLLVLAIDHTPDGIYVFGNQVDALKTLVDLNADESSAFDLDKVIFLAFLGAIGGAVSILTRINQFAHADQDDVRRTDFLSGNFKPLIGVAASLFVYAMIEAGLLPLKFAEGGGDFGLMIVCFVAGFSERLFTDLISKTEAAVSKAADRGTENMALGAAEEQQPKVSEAARAQLAEDLSGGTEVSVASLYEGATLDALESADPEVRPEARESSVDLPEG